MVVPQSSALATEFVQPLGWPVSSTFREPAPWLMNCGSVLMATVTELPKVEVDLGHAHVVLADDPLVNSQGLAEPLLSLGVPVVVEKELPAPARGHGHIEGVRPEQAAVDVEHLLGRPQGVGVPTLLREFGHRIVQGVRLHILEPAHARQGGQLLEVLDLAPVVGSEEVVLPEQAGTAGQDLTDRPLLAFSWSEQVFQ